jgi:hypothetical protein
MRRVSAMLGHLQFDSSFFEDSRKGASSAGATCRAISACRADCSLAMALQTRFFFVSSPFAEWRGREPELVHHAMAVAQVTVPGYGSWYELKK